jgi:hypothetical protein
MNAFQQSYLQTLERHRAAFATVEQYQDQALLWLDKVKA